MNYIKDTIPSLAFPLPDNGLFRTSDVLAIQGFPYRKSWIHKHSKEGGNFIKPVKHCGQTFYRGKDVNKWFDEIIRC